MATSRSQMALLPEHMTDNMISTVSRQIEDTFPVETNRAKVEVKNVHVTGNRDPYDLDRLQKVRRRRGTLQLPIKADITTTNKVTGQKATKKGHIVGHIPIATPHYSYLVDGTEYQVSAMPRMKAGLYPSERANGELTVYGNIIEGMNFDISKHNKADRVLMKFKERGGSINIVPILRLLSVPDDNIAKALGKGVLEDAKKAKPDVDVKKFASAVKGRAVHDADEAKSIVFDYMANSSILPDVSKNIYGKAHKSVNGDSLLDASEYLMDMQRGAKKPVPKHTMLYREVFRGDDVLGDKIRRSKRAIHRTVTDNLDKHAGDPDNIDKVVSAKLFDRPIKAFFTMTASANAATQLNPIDMLGGATAISPWGEGGVGEAHSIGEDVKETGYTQFGMIDPIHTPESDKAGVNLHMATGSAVIDRQLHAKLYNPKTKKIDLVSVTKYPDLNIAFRDEYKVDKNKMNPVNDKVRVFGKHGDMGEVKPSEVDYIVPSASYLFDDVTNSVPFLQNNQGNRAGMAVRHLSQAVSLKDPEEPLVQATKSHMNQSMEQMIGKSFSFHAPVNGVVEKVDEDEIVIRTPKGKKETVTLYNNYPLNDVRSFIDSNPKVAVGQSVSEGDILADTNYTKDGVLSIGKNLRTAYLPFMGLTFEDAVVISESAAKRLTSEHLYETRVSTSGDDVRVDKEAYRQYAQLPSEQADNIDENGIIKPGSVVNVGDVLVASLNKREWDKTMDDLSKIRKSFARGLEWKDGALRWDGSTQGTVVRVDKTPDGYSVLIKTEEVATAGDKISGRHGNKGIISKVLPDEEMPKNAEGVPVELLVNPTTVGGRINSGQILETATAKLAQASGEPILVRNFVDDEERIWVEGHWRTVHTGPGGKKTERRYIKGHWRDYTSETKKRLEEHGISETEELFDAKTGKSLGQILVGPQYTLKLTHTVNKKLAARGVESSYDINRVPKGGGHHGAQAFGELGNYVMLAHGAVHNLREAQTIKSDMDQHDYWYALQTGDVVPPPKTSYAYSKFLGYLNALGVNVERQGDNLTLAPMTKKSILDLSNGAIDPSITLLKTPFREKKGGLFDPEKTGGLEGNGWTHMKLERPIPNPIFERAIKSLLGATGPKYESLTGAYEGYIYKPPTLGTNENGDIVSATEATKVGASAVQDLLSRIDIDKEIDKTQSELLGAPNNTLDALNRKLKYLKMLKRNKIRPESVYMQEVVPVLPPAFRPVLKLKDGSLRFDGINELYRDMGILNMSLKTGKDLPEDEKLRVEAALTDSLRALAGVGTKPDPKKSGILQILSGASPGNGYIHKKLLKRKQDLSMRSTIVPEPSMSLDEIGIPEDGAYQIYAPFVMQQMVLSGYSPLEARQNMEARTPVTRRVLDGIMAERPVMMKRDPALHIYNIQAFKPKIMAGSAIKIHPLICEGFNADFDGDSVCGDIVVCRNVSELNRYKVTDINVTSEGDKMPHMGSLITTENIDIANFPRVEDSKRIDDKGVVHYDVPEDTYVPTVVNDSFKLGVVTEFTIHPECEEWIIETYRDRTLQVSGDHSLAVFDPETGDIAKCKPRDANDLCVPVLSEMENNNIVSLLGASKLTKKENGMIYEVPLDKDAGWLMGVYIGSGYCKNAKVYFGLNDKYPEVEACLRSFLPLYASGRIQNAKDNIIYLCNGPFARWISDLCGADEPHLPIGWIQMPLAFRRGLLRGILDSKATVALKRTHGTRANIEINTVHKKLAQDITLLTHTLGGAASYYQRTSKKYDIFTSAIHPTSLCHDKGDKWFTFVSEDKQKVLDAIYEKHDPIRLNKACDFVPFPSTIGLEIRERLVEMGGARKERSVEMYNIYVNVARWLKMGRAPRTTCNTLVKMSEKWVCSERLIKWLGYVLNDKIKWDYIKVSAPTGDHITMYDITVPGSLTFTMSNGVLVWDTVSMYVPVGPEAVEEAKEMFPSRNLFHPASGNIMFKPSLEQQLGVYLASLWGDKTNKKYPDVGSVQKAHQNGDIKINDVVSVKGKNTTAGRVLLNSILEPKDDSLLYGKETILTGGSQSTYLKSLAQRKPGIYGRSVDELRRLGDRTVYDLGWSYSLDDFMVPKKLRGDIMNPAVAKVKAVDKMKLTDAEKLRRKEDIMITADIALEKAMDKHMSNNRLIIMKKAGIKPKWIQMKQFIGSPGLYQNAKGETIPVPVITSYAEGLSSSEYTTAAHGVRKGLVEKVVSVRKPGYLSKQSINSMMGLKVEQKDCGVKEGDIMSVGDPRVLNNYLASPVEYRGTRIPAGSLITPDVLSTAKKAKIENISVRSTLKCHTPGGVCQKCFGASPTGKPFTLGTHAGILAGQSIGERTTQLSMRVFHTGGALERKKTITGAFDTVNDLLLMQPRSAKKSVLATEKGNVTSIIRNPETGGKTVSIGKLKFNVPSHREVTVKVGDAVNKGQQITDGETDPKELLKLTDVSTVRTNLSNRLFDLFKGEGVRKPMVDTIVRALTDTALIRDPGANKDFSPGDKVSLSVVEDWNRKQSKTGKNLVEYEPILVGFNMKPHLDKDWLARLNYNTLKRSVIEAAQQGQTSNLHGTNPIPGLIFGAEFGEGKDGITY